MPETTESEARKFLRVTSGAFRDTGFSAQHDYGKENVPWKEFEIVFALIYERKAASSLYLLFYVKNNPVLYYFDGNSINYRALLKNDYTGRVDTDFTTLIRKFAGFLEASCIDQSIRDFLKGGRAFLPTFPNMPKVAEYAESVRTRERIVPQDHSASEDKGIDEFLAEGSRIWGLNEVIDGRFKVLKFLQGGMGFVYIVTDMRENKPFAVKTFQDKYLWERKIIKMFTREAEVWVRVGRHKNIVTAEFVKNIEGKPYIFLEYVDGEDLRTLLKKEPLNTIVALDFAIQFCSGMLYANEKLGIIHRDVKPSNCMITSDGILKITDFGLVHIFHERTGEEMKGSAEPIGGGDVTITQTGAFKGTLPYMAPERFKDAETEIQSDIYSFGVMMYEILTARQPIQGESMDEWMTRHINEIPTPPGELNRQIPRVLSDVIMKCLEKDPANRYIDFRELRTVLLPIYEHLAGESYPLDEVPDERPVEEWLTEGDSLEALEKYREALQCYEHALKIDNQIVKGWHGKARMLGYLGNTKTAVKCYETAIRLDPGDSRIWYDKGNLHFQISDLAEALKCYDTSISIDEEFAEVWNKKGQLLDITNRATEALTCYDQALKINPRLADAWNNKGNLLYKKKHFKAAEKCYDEALKINPRKTFAWYNKGNISSILNNQREAIDFYQKALDVEPDYIPAWIGKAMANIRLNQKNEALQCLNDALEIDRKNITLLNLKAGVLENNELYEESLQCHEEILKIDEKNTKSRVGIAQILIKLHDYENAYEAVHKALSIDRDNKVYMEFMNDIRRLMEYKKEALQSIRSMAGKTGAHKIDGKFSLVLTQVTEEDKKEQSSFWGRFLKKGGPQSKVNLDEILDEAEGHYIKNEFEDALLSIEKFLQEDTENRMAWDLAGNILREMGQKERAMECRLKALEVDEASTQYWLRRGMIHEEGAEIFDALMCYQKAVLLEPGNLDAIVNSIFCMEELGYSGIARFQALELLEIVEEKFTRGEKNNLNHKLMAILSMLLSRFTEASQHIDAVMTTDQKDSSLYVLKGRVLSAFGKVAEELMSYNEALKLSPDDPDILILKGIASEREYRIQEAKRCFDVVLQLKPKDLKAWYYKGRLNMNLNDYEESLRCFNKVLELRPESVRGWIIKGIHMKRNQKEQDALWAFNKAAELNPSNADAHMNRGILLLSLNRYSEALSSFDAITEHDPENDRCWTLKGVVSQKLREFDKSIECCMRALRINPRSTDVLVTLGCTFSIMRKHKEAHSWINKALRVDNRLSVAWMNRGVLLAREGSQGEALQAFDKALEIHPECAVCWYNKGVFLALMGKIEESLACFDRSLMLNKRFAQAWVNRGNVQLHFDRSVEAMKCFDTALEIESKDPAAWCRKGVVLMILENYQEALKSLNKALRHDPASVEALVNKGITLSFLDRKKDATAHIEEAAKISREFAEKISKGAFRLEQAKKPEILETMFGPYMEDNPDFSVYEKKENFMKREYLPEIFGDDKSAGKKGKKKR